MFYKVKHISLFPSRAAVPKGATGLRLGGGGETADGGERKGGSREDITKGSEETGPSYCYCSWPNHNTMGP